MKNVISSSLVIALGIILIYHFILFWTQGRVIIEEPNKLILAGETVLSLVIVVFGIERLIRS